MKRGTARSLGTAALWLALGCATPGSVPPGESPRVVRALAAATTIGEEEFQAALAERLRRIPEFEEIRKWAEARNLRVWLAGGSATGIGAYLREELQTGAADAQSFPYSYFDIYRSTQDADIVLDAGEAEAKALEAMLREKLGYLQGSKEIWEVRLLKQSRGSGAGKKDPIIGSADFRNQNSDSYSTGLVEVTTPPTGENRIRDAFDWENHRDPTFVRDLLEGKLTFHRNPLHANTSRAVAGYNPEIVSVIRALTKAFQYDAVVTEEGMAEMRKIVDGFDPRAALGPEAVRYVLGNAAKLYQHARDLEEAEETLRQLGLLEKLADFARMHRDVSLERLLRREPLRSYPLGEAPFFTDVAKKDFGKTAAQLGIDTVAHETGNFLAYENITMARGGRPNFFISREGAPGEAAVHGNGVYTARGRTGARGTQLTIRFAVDPRAVCGRDFFVAAGEYVVFRNANAFRRLPEDALSLSVTGYAKLLQEGKFNYTDLGVMKKLELKLQSRVTGLDAEEVSRIADWITTAIRKKDAANDVALGYLLRVGVENATLAQVIEREFLRGSRAPGRTEMKIATNHGFLKNYAEILVRNGHATETFEWLLYEDYQKQHVDAMAVVLGAVSDSDIARVESSISAFMTRKGEYRPITLAMRHARVLVFDRIHGIYPEHLDDFAQGIFPYDLKGLAEIADAMERLGYGEYAFDVIGQHLGRKTYRDWRSARIVEINDVLFSRFNRLARAREKLPDWAWEWAVDPRNPDFLRWIAADPGKYDPLKALWKFSGFRSVEATFANFRRVYADAKRIAPARALELVEDYVRCSECFDTEALRRQALDLMVVEGHGADAEKFLLLTLKRWQLLEIDSRRLYQAPFFGLVNERMRKHATPPKALWEWAYHPGNPERLHWLRVWIERTGDRVGVLASLVKHGAAAIPDFAFFGEVLRAVRASHPGVAQKQAREALFLARESLRYDPVPTNVRSYLDVLREIRTAGFDSLVETTLVNDLAWTEGKYGSRAGKEGAELRSGLLATLTEYVEAKGAIPGALRKWAATANHPGRERMAELPAGESESVRRKCSRWLGRARDRLRIWFR